jgi:flagellar biosynthesis/type III secretory pathway chaperone
MAQPVRFPGMSPQQQLLEQLRKHLDAELAVQRRLLTLAEQMTPRLIAGDTKGFQQIAIEEDQPIREAARLAGIRDKLARALAAVFQLTGAPTLSQVVPKAPDPVRGELERLRRELRQVCERLAAVSTRNLALIRQGLALVRDALGSAAGDPSAPSLYDRRGLTGTPVTLRGLMLDLRG